MARELAPPVEARNQEVAALTYTKTPTQTCFLPLFPSLYQARTFSSVLGENTSATLQQWRACYLRVSLLPPFQEVRVIYGLIYMRRQAAARSSRAAEGKSVRKTDTGGEGGESVFGAWRSGTDVDGGSLIMGAKKRSRRLFSPLISPPADVCSGAPAGVASRHFISPSKRPSH